VSVRRIVLDSETPGLESAQGHRIIEIGGVELVDRRLTRHNFHCYLQPDREIDADAVRVHGITNAFLAGKPRFAEVARELIAYLSGAELIIHNATFDVGFLDAELHRWAAGQGSDPLCIGQVCQVTDTLAMARQLHPGQRNSLDALCKRYNVDTSQRQLHGALLDASLLAEVYLAMTGGQVRLSLDASAGDAQQALSASGVRWLDANRPALRVIGASPAEIEQHQARLQGIHKASGGHCLWLRDG
jgi:DNA polymerase III epsilon subunit